MADWPIEPIGKIDFSQAAAAQPIESIEPIDFEPIEPIDFEPIGPIGFRQPADRSQGFLTGADQPLGWFSRLADWIHWPIGRSAASGVAL